MHKYNVHYHDMKYDYSTSPGTFTCSKHVTTIESECWRSAVAKLKSTNPDAEVVGISLFNED